ncbi:Glutaredoxin-related protein [Handroanthus impetiginosus]|uniref:Glutaredoxin-related protein n=1 Tax=Handroanthus impetiginosus TaxID=429701 RepID=A0A2G9GID5_9LAMI|nr:Glutaredoxin-related protein [Handroanthus impetiginosus]
MGCASSTLLNQDDEFFQIGGSPAFSHHIVSLTSSTYGLLTLDPPPPARIEQHSSTTTVPPMPAPPPPPPRITLGSLFPSPLSEPRSLSYQPLETIHSWDLMSGLDSDSILSFRFSPSPFVPLKLSNSLVNKKTVSWQGNEENFSPNVSATQSSSEINCSSKSSEGLSGEGDLLDGFEMISPPNGENKVVLYATTLRGVRKTFEDCNAVRLAIEGFGILFSERDISMDRGFRDELKELMKGKGSNELIPPRLFVKGRYVGGAEEVMRIVEEGRLGELLQGLPKMRKGWVCEGCGGVRFLPCFTCNGSCKMLIMMNDDSEVEVNQGNRTVIMRCSDCNENGLVRCPICT